MPPECDVSIRPGWFWHAAEDSRVKTPRQLLGLYYRSAGRGGSLLLNVPPDRRGLLHENDVASLRGFGKLMRDTFRENLAASAKVKASTVRGNLSAFGPERLLDSDRYTYWSTDDSVKTAEVEITLPAEATFNVIRLRENIELDRWTGVAWDTFARGTSIGAFRFIRTREGASSDHPVGGVSALSEIGLFLEAAVPYTRGSRSPIYERCCSKSPPPASSSPPPLPRNRKHRAPSLDGPAWRAAPSIQPIWS
jgi:alpha-L-fucosidase